MVKKYEVLLTRIPDRWADVDLSGYIGREVLVQEMGSVSMPMGIIESSEEGKYRLKHEDDSISEHHCANLVSLIGVF